MLVRVKERIKTTIGTIDPGIVDLPVADVLRLVRDGTVDIMEEGSDESDVMTTKRNGMLKTYLTR